MSIPADDRFFIIAGIIGLALLLMLVGLIAALRNRYKSADEPSAENAPAPSWVKNIAGAAGKTLTGTARTAGMSVNAPPDALVVLRDTDTNEWVVELNGLRYQNLRDIHDDKAAGKVMAAIDGLRRFVGISMTAAPPPAADKPTATDNVPIVPPGESIPYAPPATTPRMEPAIVAALTQTTTISKPKYPAPPNSILDQIEKVLQRNLAKEPDLAARRIHIGAAGDGSLLIEVDWSTYKSAEEVPEERIRNVIKAAIQEWERTA
jgi:hypothetical protein